MVYTLITKHRLIPQTPEKVFNFFPYFADTGEEAFWICPVHRVIETISEHIAAEEPLTGGGEAVGIDEAAEIGVVITALQVIESRLLGMEVAEMAFLWLFSRRGEKHL